MPAVEKPRRVRDARAVREARRQFCQLCGDTRGPFHVHHIRSRGAGGGDVPENLVSLCWKCHGEVHAGRRALEELEEREFPGLELLLQAFADAQEAQEEQSWALGAVLVVMVHGLGLSVGEAASRTGWSKAKVRASIRTFCAFPEPGSRAKDLTWTHHRLAAHTADPEGWIDRAAAEGWSTREMREAILREGASEEARREFARAKAERALRLAREVLEEGGEAAFWLRERLGKLLAECAGEVLAHA